MRTADLLELTWDDIMRMETRELRAAVRQLGKTANSRLAYSEKRGYNTPATEGLRRSGGKISTAGKNLNKLRSEYARARGFLTSKTSTAKGAKEWAAETKKGLEEEGVEVPKGADMSDVWKAYDRIQKSVGFDKTMKYSVLETITDMMESGENDVDNIVNTITNNLDRIYQEEQEERARVGLPTAGDFMNEFFED